MEIPAWPLALALGALLAALVAVRRTIQRPLNRMTDWLVKIRSGRFAKVPELPRRSPLVPLAREAATLARTLAEARFAAEQEARLRRLGDSLWTADRLRDHIRSKLAGRPLVLVANREPYRHTRKGRVVTVETPASGLVTGLEPILRACGGTWVAQGDGDADRETSDAQGRLRVPPDSPQYTLKRVWLTKEEEDGYYYGFANEGLWPLCHIVHTRPTFRPDDFRYYRKVNAKFARAVLQEIAGLEEPLLLIQDYHFTLLPKLLKDARPDARVALFWHIPWPNPEAFRICPWQSELLEGMLGADLIGFHTQYHCNNFFDTVDRALECRIDRERFAVSRGDKSTVIKPFPISVDFPEPPPRAPLERGAERSALLRALGLEARFVAVGVDRVDYTKGLLERFMAVERFLEKNAAYRGTFTLLQIGAPSRIHIPAYSRLNQEIEAEARRINERFPSRSCPPIVLLQRHHSHGEIQPYYRAADVCLVTSLHDGMNLVAKEFVVARDDDRGALVLSRFTGAARELEDALIVNPYDADEVADAIRAALEMDEAETIQRMARLRATVRDNNIYRWAASLINEFHDVRLEPASKEA